MRSALLVLAALLLAGCTKGGPPAGGDVVEETFRLHPLRVPGYWNETDLRVNGGDEVRWSFTATGPVAWDVHTHEGERVVVLANGTHTETRESFTPEKAGVYSLYLQNPSRDKAVDVTLRIEGEFERA